MPFANSFAVYAKGDVVETDTGVVLRAAKGLPFALSFLAVLMTSPIVPRPKSFCTPARFSFLHTLHIRSLVARSPRANSTRAGRLHSPSTRTSLVAQFSLSLSQMYVNTTAYA